MGGVGGERREGKEEQKERRVRVRGLKNEKITF